MISMSNLKMLNPGVSCFKVGVLILHVPCRVMTQTLPTQTSFKQRKAEALEF